MNINAMFGESYAEAPTGHAMIVADKQAMQVTFTHAAYDARANAMGIAYQVAQVTNPQEQVEAVRAQALLKELVKLVKDQITTETDKANDYKKRLWAARDGFLLEAE